MKTIIETIVFKCICIVCISLFVMFLYAAFIQGGYAYGKESTLKFPTKNIREMWLACSIEFRRIRPTMLEESRVYLCDCYTEYMRKNFTPEYVLKMTPEQARLLGFKMRTICPFPTTPQINT